PFTPLFLGSVILLALGVLLFSRVQADSTFSVGEFAGMFVHGNPLLAFESLIGYYRARDERATVVSTERMGRTKSPLTVDEMLEALQDPRFNVRFEAIISIARMGSEPRLVKALCHILDGTELSLSVISAWALGRIGDDEALPSLRNGLNSSYRSIQAHCARSLGTLNDQQVAPLLLERLRTETDKGLRIAFASALGNLRSKESVDLLFEVLDTIDNDAARIEVALAIARVLGDEHRFIRLLRNLRQDSGTTAAQVIAGWQRKMSKTFPDELEPIVRECGYRFASDQMDEAAAMLGQVLEQLPRPSDDSVSARILDKCVAHLKQPGVPRFEYLLLTLFTLQTTTK
ncbi:MAG: HEAT repeat domain-containing protein, partial [Anaerolineae bacterium]|nr:HEAT repeat domain-containing protein [Anaerolineae bacterium]